MIKVREVLGFKIDKEIEIALEEIEEAACKVISIVPVQYEHVPGPNTWVLINVFIFYEDYAILVGNNAKRKKSKMIEETLCPKCKSRMKSVLGKNGRYWLCKKLGCGGTRDSMGRSKEDRENEYSKEDED